MDPRKGNIFEILNGNKQFIIPIYQRYYSWEREHCQRLWNDIVMMQKRNKKVHFVGSIVNIGETVMPTGVQKFMIIDGQQRMTTLTLLMIALRDYADEHPEDKSINPRRIDNMLLKNAYEEGDDRYKMLLTKRDREVLIDLIEKRPLPDKTDSRIIENYNFFKSCIEDMEIPPDKVYESVGKLEIVNITLDREVDDPQAIFESLNSTGKELSESDLIRNYILMGLEPDKQNFLYENYWRPMELMFDYGKNDSKMDNFFRDYLTMKTTSIPRKDKVYERFKEFRLNSEFDGVEDLCKDLLKNAKFYTNMVFEKSDNLKLKKLYKDINSLRMQVVYPFLLQVHNDYFDGIISEKELFEIIKMCIDYVLRRSICNIPTNSLNKTFATFKRELIESDYVNSVRTSFLRREGYREFPDDDKFKFNFINKDIYNMKNRNYILSSLENYDNKAPINIGNYTVEHIMPQTGNLNADWKKMLGSDWKEIQKQYLHTIGNLTLTAYNSEMSDHSFPDKMDMKGGFKESALRLNSFVVKQNIWNEEKIKERAKILADKAVEIWKYPKLSDTKLD